MGGMCVNRHRHCEEPACRKAGSDVAIYQLDNPIFYHKAHKAVLVFSKASAGTLCFMNTQRPRHHANPRGDVAGNEVSIGIVIARSLPAERQGATWQSTN